MVWPFFLYRPFNPYPKAKQRDLIWNTFIWTLVSLLPNDSRSCQQITTRFSSSSSPSLTHKCAKRNVIWWFNNETVKLILMKYVFKFRMEAMHVTYGLRNDFPFSLFWMWRYIGVYIRVRKHKSGTSVADFSSSPLRCLQFPSDANLPQASSPILISISITIYMGMSVCKRRGWRELSLHLHYSE